MTDSAYKPVSHDHDAFVVKRDRYRAMVEWLANRRNECRDCGHYRATGECEGCNANNYDDWLEVAEEEVRNE